jgi:hypothetical protein
MCTSEFNFLGFNWIVTCEVRFKLWLTYTSSGEPASSEMCIYPSQRVSLRAALCIENGNEAEPATHIRLTNIRYEVGDDSHCSASENGPSLIVATRFTW